MQFKRNKFGLEYEKNKPYFFHIPNYKPITFVSTRFLDDDLQRHTVDVDKLDDVLELEDPNAEQEDKDDDDVVDDVKLDEVPEQCQHCHRVGHIE